MSDERIEINCAVPGHWVDEVLGGVHDGGLPEDPRTPCVTLAGYERSQELLAQKHRSEVNALNEAARLGDENRRLRVALQRVFRAAADGECADVDCTTPGCWISFLHPDVRAVLAETRGEK